MAGREAIIEALRHPDDFDGIIAGAPAMLFQVQDTLHHGRLARTNTDAAGKSILPLAKLTALHAAVLAACDAQDGLAEGLVSQPALCTFDPAAIVCAEGQDGDASVTATEVAVVRKLYDGPPNALGMPLTPRRSVYGSERNWQGVFVPDAADQPPFSAIIAEPVLKHLAFDPARPDMTLADLEFSTATLGALRVRHPAIDATSLDLSGFAASGGKLILWYGLADPHIAPANTLTLCKAMIVTLGAEKVQGLARLHLLPGPSHCRCGQGPSQLDLVTPMMAWVETGTAPDAVATATTAETSTFGQPDEVVGRGGMRPSKDLGVVPLPDVTRPVFPWPATAAFTGTGAPWDAATWTRGSDAKVMALRDGAGADLFAPFTPRD